MAIDKKQSQIILHSSTCNEQRAAARKDLVLSVKSMRMPKQGNKEIKNLGQFIPYIIIVIVFSDAKASFHMFMYPPKNYIHHSIPMTLEV